MRHRRDYFHVTVVVALGGTALFTAHCSDDASTGEPRAISTPASSGGAGAASGGAPVADAAPDAAQAAEEAEEFVGPFASWKDAKRDHGARGDGESDDTAALQAALDALPADGSARALWIPAGTYVIRQTLTIGAHRGLSVLGEDPARTIISWRGEPGGEMLRLDGTGYSRFGRITWDGNQIAETAVAHRWSGVDTGGTYPGFNEHADEVFRNVGYGIRAGQDNRADAETAVLGCHFEGCTQAGVSIESWNALDWFVRGSSFQDCALGVTNTRGAGNFHVSDSVFARSTEADVKIHNTLYFSLRRNVSQGSAAFFVASPIGSNAAGTTLQGNTIYAPAGVTPVKVGNLGPLFLLDNVVRTEGDALAVAHDDGPARTVSVGNTFTSETAVRSSGSLLTLDDKVVTPASLPPLSSSVPAALENRRRPVLEVAADAGGDAIQLAIDQAVALAGQRPVVHIAGGGSHAIERTLVVPAGADLQLVGDGEQDRLAWNGAEGGTLLRLEGPSHATVRDLALDGGRRAVGLAITRADQPGGHVRMEQAFVAGATDTSLLVDRLGETRVDLPEFYHAGSAQLGVHVVGAPPGRSQTVLYGGASSDTPRNYAVDEGGALMAQDIWYEGRTETFARFDGSGTFTLQGARIAMSASPQPTLELANFTGRVTLLATLLDGNVRVSAGGAPSLLALGVQFAGDNRVVDESASGRVSTLASFTYTGDVGATPIEDTGPSDPNTLREMLAQTRGTSPLPLHRSTSGVTNVRVHRVFIESVTSGIVVSAGG